MQCLRLIFCLLLGLIITQATFAREDIYDSEDPQYRNAQNVSYPLVGNIEMISAHQIDYAKPRIVAKSVYPELLGYGENDDSVENFNQIVADLIKVAIQDFTARIPPAMTPSKEKNTLAIDYNASAVVTGKHHLLSIRFNIQGYAATLSRPYHYYRVLNYDLDEGQAIELSSLFQLDAPYLNVLSDYARQSLARRVNNRNLLEQSTAAQIENFANWNIKQTGLLFTFDAFQTSSSSFGSETVLIPYSVLAPVLSHQSILAKCAMPNSKRCVRSQVVTGGFINQALKHTSVVVVMNK